MNEDLLRAPPSNTAIEACVIGCMLLKPDLLDDALALVDPEWFYRPAHQVIYKRIRTMAARGVPVDAALLQSALIDAGEYESIGGYDYLANLLSGVPNADSMEYYADVIRDKAMKRKLIQAGTETVDRGYDSSVTAEDALGDSYAGLQRITADRGDRSGHTIGEAIAETLDHAERVALGEVPEGLRTGFTALDDDKLGGGLQPGELVILAAETSVGKSTVACSDWVRSFCKQGAGVVLASAEMGAAEIACRILAAESNVAVNKIRGGKYSAAELYCINEAREKIGAWKLKILDESRTIADIAANAKREFSGWGTTRGAVIVDYLQLMEPEDPRANKEERIGTMALRCKQAATRMRVPWIALSQFNRGHKGARQWPGLSNLRDSGQIEQHANIVILLHPLGDKETYSDSPEAGHDYYEIAVYVAKNRNGLTHSGWGTAATRKVRYYCGRTDP